MLVCLYEDRPYQVAGLKILLLSLNRYASSWPIRLRFPGISEEFRQWLSRFSQLTLVEERLALSGSYNVKPSVLLDGLATGADACLWFDTDVLVNGSLEFLSEEAPDTVIVTQDPWEYPDGSTHRCASWGLIAGRSLPGPLNSAVVRVTQQHKALLDAWQTVLSTDAYLAEQAKPIPMRNRHILGDQDAISALLASVEFTDVPVRRLRHASEILQHHGAGAYGPGQRWDNLLHGLPPLIHAMGSVKPWKMPSHPSLRSHARDYYERVYLELSPYVHLARQYREQLHEPAEWLDVQTIAGRLSSIVTFNRPTVKGTIQATLHRKLSGKQ
jgi:hypothetical protein